MTARYTGGGGGGYDYVQSGTPSQAEEGESWYETDTDTAYAYNGTSWIETTVTDHGQLSGVSAADHHAKPTGGSGIGFDSTNNEFDALLGNALGIDANGNIYVKEGGVSHDNLAGVSASDHHAKPTGGSGIGFDSTNNEFDALLGNALGIDANGNIYVKEGGVSHDNLAGVSASDHHAKPTGTQSGGQSRTYITPVVTSSSNSGSGDVTQCVNHTLKDNVSLYEAVDFNWIEVEGQAKVDGARVYIPSWNSTSNSVCQFTTTGGGTELATISASAQSGATGWFSRSFGGEYDGFRINDKNNYGFSLAHVQAREDTATSHSHSI